ncbi:hypothetical protein GCQ56_08035 [Marinifilum sp. N1E240]|uniref:hypothetical protein n=1 Tax=Marinifilum sp. N1E240 TaxID=2608082 RepID=UPI00128E0CA7|nr:hypothetical protein [Marinifilum sp. N1E240]MPQ46964.1 hypothetical protein [Marinifilum sp. N1E240]
MKQKIKYIFYTLKVDMNSSFQVSDIWNKLKEENAHKLSPFVQGDENEIQSSSEYGKYTFQIHTQFEKFLKFMRKNK